MPNTTRAARLKPEALSGPAGGKDEHSSHPHNRSWQLRPHAGHFFLKARKNDEETATPGSFHFAISPSQDRIAVLYIDVHIYYSFSPILFTVVFLDDAACATREDCSRARNWISRISQATCSTL